MTELQFVSKFQEYCDKHKDINFIHIEKDSCSNHMDCEIEYKNEYIRLEAKVLNDTRNNSQKLLKTYGGLLKGRNLEQAKDSNYTTVYGVLVRKSQENIAMRIFKAIDVIDWNLFGKSFDVRYIFIFDDRNNKLYIEKWNDFIAQ